VALHMLGAALLVVASVALLLSTRERVPAAAAEQPDVPARGLTVPVSAL
jgi:hypothetical protein